MKKIVIATHNDGKLAMIKEFFQDFRILSLNDFEYFIEPEENGATFEENAIEKAKFYHSNLNEICIADDSGICIPVLNNFPGVRTKRWFKGNDRERNLAILDKLKDFEKIDRKVNFITAIAIAIDDTVIAETEILSGYIADSPRGENGFGFDEIFELENGKTLAELSFEEKLEISTRKKALEKIKKYLK